MAEKHTHIDCRNFGPVDVAKGLCLRSKEPVAADDGVCSFFDRMPKCGLCSRYSVSRSQPSLGKCGAEKGEPMAYAELPAVNCKDFEWKDRR